MVLPPTSTAKHITLPIPHCLQMHQPLTRKMHLHLSLLSSKAPSHNFNTFMYIKGLLYKHVMNSDKKFFALVIPKSWHFTILVEAHDKLGHRGVNRTYHLIKHQYYWKGMNKYICKYIINCVLSKREKATQVYLLQMTDISDRPFDKTAIDLVSDLNVSASGNHHLLTIIDHLTGWPEALPIPDKKTDTFVHIFINNYLPIHMFPCFILSDNCCIIFSCQLTDIVLAWL